MLHSYDSCSAAVVVMLGLVVRLRFPPGDRQTMKPVCGLGHGQSVCESFKSSVQLKPRKYTQTVPLAA